MKNKIFITSLVTLALTFVVSGCSLYGGTTKVAPTTRINTTVTETPVTSTEPVETSLVMKASVDISSFAFNPATLTVKKGTTITWTNNDQAPHAIKSESFNSDILKNGQKYSMTFGDVGIFNYSCSVHPSMTGQIIVE
ncbi:MAG: plastocyanin/azurin family copper-binding protein [Patescibacteria group bacterium]